MVVAEGRKSPILLLALFVFSMLATPAGCAVSGANGLSPMDYLLADGTVEYEGWFCWHTPAVVDPYAIEVFMNVSRTVSTEVTSVSESTVEFVSTVFYSADNVYQKRNSIIYRPSSYGIRYYDSSFNFIGTDDTTYTVTCQVNKETGIYTLYHAPQGAAAASFTAYYTSTYVYEYTSALPLSFDKSGEVNGLFLPDASDFTVGTIVRENYTVSGSSEYSGFDTWVLEPRSNLEGFDVFEDHIEFEKKSGLFIGQDSEFGETNVFDFEYHLWATDFADVIIIPAAGLPVDVLTIGTGVVGVVAVVSVSAILLRRRRAPQAAAGENTQSGLM